MCKKFIQDKYGDGLQCKNCDNIVCCEKVFGLENYTLVLFNYFDPKQRSLTWCNPNTKVIHHPVMHCNIFKHWIKCPWLCNNRRFTDSPCWVLRITKNYSLIQKWYHWPQWTIMQRLLTTLDIPYALKHLQTIDQ